MGRWFPSPLVKEIKNQLERILHMNELTQSIQNMQVGDKITLEAKMIGDSKYLVITDDTTDVYYQIGKKFFEEKEAYKIVTKLPIYKNTKGE
jgi:hypothetical protein